MQRQSISTEAETKSERLIRGEMDFPITGRDNLETVVPEHARAQVGKHSAVKTGQPTCMGAKGVDFFYGAFKALSDVSLDIPSQNVTALIGPSGCGKSTFLRCLNRMNDEIPGTRITGKVT